MLISGSQSELKRMQFVAEVDGSMQMRGNSQSRLHVKKYAEGQSYKIPTL